MTTDFPESTDDWLLAKGPRNEVVVSSRARLARNLPDYPFAAHASKEQLAAVDARIQEGLESSAHFGGYRRYDISEISNMDRRFLKESHLISSDLEKGALHRAVYLNGEARTSIMINEEDHLRIQTMLAGLQIGDVYAQIEDIEKGLEENLKFAYTKSFGYLTACPTNTGTGLRVSVMVHLVGLSMTGQIEDALGSLGNFGLVVRGAYGEHSNPVGDLYQISNEVTLGKTEESLVEILEQVATQIIDRELQARELLSKHEPSKFEDAVCRAIGILSSARTIDTGEAVGLLSRIRLGLSGKFGLNVSDEELNRLLIEVQPAHLRRRSRLIGSTENGDVARATLLRERIHNGGPLDN